ncbi:tripartite tricarboxylate transporter TctB family protein [Uliginosibacterium sp. 31-12]|uniref:tripartite tricarboxylate transporter TctB family protein n=1 Tax=Uliginosibacterium sp. 31-12 TaxID=3062781 RepID=UPI0026E2C557|nr:tripartite tricarboxylate transporter TctB family protein [Uliginosibacterium sp. 31-12]MDO6386509.1 tripartite tricarboxylate transporter TctB family protein [Uliginosibacterium sp. 31-12]
MSNIRTREFAVGIVFLLIGLGYLYMTSQLPRKQFIDAAFVPYVLAITMCLLGGFQLWDASKVGTDAPAKADDKADYRTVVKTLGLIIAYAALLEPLGFPVITAIYLFAQFIVLTPNDHQVSLPKYALIAVLTSAIVYATFRYAFDMLLPVGVLSAFLN